MPEDQTVELMRINLTSIRILFLILFYSITISYSGSNNEEGSKLRIIDDVFSSYILDSQSLSRNIFNLLQMSLIGIVN